MRIHDILDGSGSADPCFVLMDPDPDLDLLFSSLTFPRCQQKTNFLKVFCLLLFEGTVHVHHFQRYKVKKKSQSSRNQGFLNFFAWWLKDPDPDPDPYGTSDWWIRIQEAQKHVDPVDPDSDPQLWSEVCICISGSVTRGLILFNLGHAVDVLWFWLGAAAATPANHCPPDPSQRVRGEGKVNPCFRKNFFIYKEIS